MTSHYSNIDKSYQEQFSVILIGYLIEIIEDHKNELECTSKILVETRIDRQNKTPKGESIHVMFK